MKPNMPNRICICVAVILLTSAVCVSGQSTPKGKPSPTPTPTPQVCPAPTGSTNYWTGSGGLDATFGLGGIVTTDLSGPTFQSEDAKSVLIQGDGKIVTVGEARNPAGLTGVSDQLVTRYNPDGSIDHTFGSPDPAHLGQRLGYIFIDFSLGLDSSAGASFDSLGRIVIASWYNAKIARLDVNGDLDPTFGTGGKIETPIPNLTPQDMVVLSNGKIILAGGEPNFTMARFNDDGSLDTTFGTGGSVSISISGMKRGKGNAQSVTTQMIADEERIVLAGGSSAGPSSPGTFALMRFMPSGAVDTSFGTGGTVLTAFGGSTHIWDHKIDSLNRIVAAGDVSSGGCAGWETAYARYLENGALDPAFSGDGKLTRDIYGSGVATARSVVIQPDGKIVSFGFAVSGDRVFYDSLLVRLLDDGTADTTFGPPGFWGGGVVTTDIGGGFDFGFGVALQPDGKIVTGGHTDAAGYASAVARYLP